MKYAQRYRIAMHIAGSIVLVGTVPALSLAIAWIGMAMDMAMDMDMDTPVTRAQARWMFLLIAGGPTYARETLRRLAH